MDRTPRQLARSERLANNSPYKRPSQVQQLVKHQQRAEQPRSPASSFPSLRSIYSFVTAPFSRQPLLPQTNQDLPIEEDQKSQSGSEDEWNGSPPAGMEDQDMFSVAAAGGRQGEDFERRAIEYRSEGVVENQGSRKVESILPLYATESIRRDTPESSTAHLQRYQTPSQIASSSSVKRSLNSVNAAISSSKPLPAFLPTAQTAKTPQSAASIAFNAFVEAKKGQTMTSEDMRVMRTLMDNIEAEQQGMTTTVKTGGWSAGHASSPRPTKSLANGVLASSAAPSTPNRLVESVRGANGALFSVGTPGGRSEAGSAGGESPASRRIRYLGPGMSPRRMQNKSRASDRPAFTTDVAEESEPKRQKVDVEVDTPQKSATASTSTSVFGSPMQIDTPAPSPPKSRALEKAKGTTTPARPSPLGQSPASIAPDSPRADDSVAQGKKRAADIVKELMQEEIGSLESLNKRDYMVINPYDIGTPGSTSQRSEASSSLSKSISRTATPKKSILRSSLRSSTSTPLSGAAAQLEAHKPGRKLTTLELLEGKKPWVGPVVDETMRSQTPSPARDAIEVDELMEDSPAPSPIKKAAPLPKAQPESTPSRPFPKMPDQFKAPSFQAPDVSSPARPLPKFAQSPSPSKPAPSSFTPSRPEPEPAQPKFALAPPKVAEPLPQIENSTLASISRSTKSTNKHDPPLAEQQALNKPASSLPTFTFNIAPSSTKIDDAVKASALARPIQQYTFTLTETSKAPVSKPAAEWTCDTCMLKNPDSAKEKCTICESPRPTASPTVSKPAPAPAAAQPAGADWTCDTCMLKNPDSAKDKCTICEAPRPAATTAAKPAFDFGQPSPAPPVAARKPGPWTCDLCMLQNPECATDKCQICEAKRP